MEKIVYSDNGRDRAILGKIVREDDYFVEVQSNERAYRIGKKSIVCVKQCDGGDENEFRN